MSKKSLTSQILQAKVALPRIQHPSQPLTHCIGLIGPRKGDNVSQGWFWRKNTRTNVSQATLIVFRFFQNWHNHTRIGFKMRLKSSNLTEN